MRIIDEKGRLFGKINIIDFLVIVVMVSLTPMVYFGYRISYRKHAVSKEQAGTKKEFIEIRARCKFIRLRPEILGMISVGDKELDSQGNLIGEIVDLGEPSAYVYEIKIGQDKKILSKDPILKQVDAILRINAHVRDESIYYKDRQILENGALAFSSGNYSVETDGIFIVEDSSNVVSRNTAHNVTKFDTLEGELNILKERVDTLFLQINGLENKKKVRPQKKLSKPREESKR